MCERTCPDCGSDDHFTGFGITGAYILCEGCGITLAARGDVDAAPLGMGDAQAQAWADERTWVLPGAEAKNPDDDAIYTPSRLALQGAQDDR